MENHEYVNPADEAASQGEIIFNAADEDGYGLRVSVMPHGECRFIASDPEGDFMASDMERAQVAELIAALSARLEADK